MNHTAAAAGCELKGGFRQPLQILRAHVARFQINMRGKMRRFLAAAGNGCNDILEHHVGHPFSLTDRCADGCFGLIEMHNHARLDAARTLMTDTEHAKRRRGA